MNNGTIADLILKTEDPDMLLNYKNIMGNVELVAALSTYKMQFDACNAGNMVMKPVPYHIGDDGKMYQSSDPKKNDKMTYKAAYPDWYSECTKGGVESYTTIGPNPEQYFELTGEVWEDESHNQNGTYEIDYRELNELDKIIICWLKDWNPWGEVSNGRGIQYLMNSGSTIKDIIDLVIKGYSRDEIRKMQFPNATK